MKKIKGHIDTELNPSKINLCDPTMNNFEEVSCVGDILNSLQISTSEYETILSVSDDNDFQEHLKRLEEILVLCITTFQRE